MSPSTQAMHPGERLALAVLPAALAAISSAAVLVRMIPEVSPITIAFCRTVGVGLLLAPALRRVSRADGLRILAAGALLAVHFTAWFASLAQTTVVRSTVLVCTSPLFAALFEALSRSERASRGARFFVGTGIAMLGVALVAAPDASAASGIQPSAGPLTGDALALFAAIAMGGYLTLGRHVRRNVGIGTYASGVGLAAAAVLLPFAICAGTKPLEISSASWIVIATLVLGPQLVGHNGFNYALRHLPASRVGAIILLEPIGASVLAGLVLGEWPGPLAAAGAVVAVVGVGVATLDLVWRSQ